jgi:hypothetical protein
MGLIVSAYFVFCIKQKHSFLFYTENKINSQEKETVKRSCSLLELITISLCAEDEEIFIFFP